MLIHTELKLVFKCLVFKRPLQNMKLEEFKEL